MYSKVWLAACALVSLGALAGCSSTKANASSAEVPPTVGTAAVERQPIARQITVSSELVPFQEIDVYAKESGYIKDLKVDYGTHVKEGQLMAVLEIPELRIQLAQDAAAVKNQEDVVQQAQHQVDRATALVKPYKLQYDRINAVSEKNPGLVAQQEVDDWQGKYESAEAQLEVAKSALLSAQSVLAASQAKEERDKVLYDYARITAPFSGVVTQRYANYGTLVQAGTSSSSNVLPICKLSEDDRFRLVIPVAEGYVKYIHVGDPVDVNVPSLGKHFPGKVTRSSTDVTQDTRTMHTEVDVLNPSGVLMPGMYADAVLTLEHKADALVVPVQALNHDATGDSVYLVTPEKRIAVRQIQLGLQSPSWAEVVSGLNEGDMVVVSDRSALKVGTAVQPHTVESTDYQSQGQ